MYAGSAGDLDATAFEFGGELVGVALRINQREVTVVVAGACDEVPPDVRRVGFQALEERLGQEGREVCIGDVRDDDVLVDGEAKLAAAVLVGEAGELGEVGGSDSPTGMWRPT